MPHRLTKAQREHIRWHKAVTGPGSCPVRHKSNDGSMIPYEATTTVLLREGYLRASKADRYGMRELMLTKKGQTA